jgi:hypothetical protein
MICLAVVILQKAFHDFGINLRVYEIVVEPVAGHNAGIHSGLYRRALNYTKVELFQWRICRSGYLYFRLV